MMSSFLRVRLVLCVVLSVGFLVPTFAQSGDGARFALVIGNGDYKDLGTLKNPVNDAQDIAKALEGLGYKVTLLTNASRKQMNSALNSYFDRLSGDSRSAGFFWYAGHGIQSKGENYLIPVGADIQRESDLEDEAISVRKVMGIIDEARNKVNVVVLDACRNNPLPSAGRSASRGLQVVSKAPPESVLMFSTGAGQVAQDGNGRNSPFASAFLKFLPAGGDITSTIKAITAETKRLTGGEQVPYLYSSLTLDFALNPQARPGSAASGTTALPPAAPAAGQGSAGPEIGSLQESTGRVEFRLDAAATLNVFGKAIPVARAGVLPVNGVSAGTYSATEVWADGRSETKAFTVKPDGTVQVAFANQSASLPELAFSGVLRRAQSGPVFSLSSPGQLGIPGTILKDGDEFRLWYTINLQSGSKTAVGLATSPDGVHWTPDPGNPVFVPDFNGYDNYRIDAPSVIKDGSTYRMWYSAYSGSTWSIALATSPDGINWTRYSGNPVLRAGANDWDREIWGATVVKKDGGYLMWYCGYTKGSGQHDMIGLATSNNGVDWQKSPSNPVFSSKSGFASSHTAYPMVMADGGTFHLWFGGIDSTGTARIGHASSRDGVNWTESSSVPVLEPGTPGSFDQTSLASPQVLRVGSEYWAWYAGWSGTSYAYGLAKSGQ